MRNIVLAVTLAAPNVAGAQATPNPVVVPAATVSATLQSARSEAPGLATARLAEGQNYQILLVRRTASKLAAIDSNWSEIWYVIGGSGMLTTGGSVDGHSQERGEHRELATVGGADHHIAKGDLITIPAGVPKRLGSVDGSILDCMVIRFRPARDTSVNRDVSKVWVYTARQLDSAAHNTRESPPGNWGVGLDRDAAYDNGLNRRTAPGGGHSERGLSEVWYVIAGGGVLVTGGTLTDPRPGKPGETRGSGIAGGEARHIAAGDIVIIPAGTPHVMRSIDGKEIVYLSPKIASTN